MSTRPSCRRWRRSKPSGRAAGARFPRRFYDRALDFSTTFVDRGRYAKEEQHLIPWLVARGVPRQGEPIEQVLEEHDRCRRHLAVVREALHHVVQRDRVARETVRREMLNYAALVGVGYEVEMTSVGSGFLDMTPTASLPSGWRDACRFVGIGGLPVIEAVRDIRINHAGAMFGAALASSGGALRPSDVAADSDRHDLYLSGVIRTDDLCRRLSESYRRWSVSRQFRRVLGAAAVSVREAQAGASSVLANLRRAANGARG